MNHEHWMRAAIAQARAGLARGQSPFGAVIVRDGALLAAGHNEVYLRGDPTAHAEIVAIQRAARAGGGIDLSGCEIYTTCEPCPMCAAAIHWARLAATYCGATIADAALAGFHELKLPAAELYARGGSPVRLTGGLLGAECAALFDEWRRGGGQPY
jgi:tRNA(Arg) A34 adenosine deaminase TadA